MAAAKKKSSMERVLIMLESIQDQQKVLAEGQTAFREALEEQLAQMEARLTRRIEVLEAAVRENSAILKAQSDELRAIRRDLELMATRAELEKLERRVAMLEGRLGV